MKRILIVAQYVCGCPSFDRWRKSYWWGGYDLRMREWMTLASLWAFVACLLSRLLRRTKVIYHLFVLSKAIALAFRRTRIGPDEAVATVFILPSILSLHEAAVVQPSEAALELQVSCSLQPGLVFSFRFCVKLEAVEERKTRRMWGVREGSDNCTFNSHQDDSFTAKKKQCLLLWRKIEHSWQLSCSGGDANVE